jgi:hypothetical protein
MTTSSDFRNFWQQFTQTASTKDAFFASHISGEGCGNLKDGDTTTFLSVPIKRNFSPTTQNSSSARKVISSLPLARLRLLGKSVTGQSEADSEATFKSSFNHSPSILNFKEVIIPLICTGSVDANELQHQIKIVCGKWPENFPSDTIWYEINQLRIHAGAPERSERGVCRLLQYHSFLLYLENQFPFQSPGSNVQFVWFESFTDSKKGM